MMRFKNIREFLDKYPCKFKATSVEEREDNLMRLGYRRVGRDKLKKGGLQ